MSYRLIVKPSAEKDLAHLPRPLQRRVLDRLVQMEANPRAPGAVNLAGSKSTYRVRVGDWRIVYEIDDARRIVFVTIIAHRREVYRGL
jgi:mRNA interferase RelE/StbE